MFRTCLSCALHRWYVLLWLVPRVSNSESEVVRNGSMKKLTGVTNERAGCGSGGGASPGFALPVDEDGFSYVGFREEPRPSSAAQ